MVRHIEKEQVENLMGFCLSIYGVKEMNLMLLFFFVFFFFCFFGVDVVCFFCFVFLSISIIFTNNLIAAAEAGTQQNLRL